MKIIRGAKSKIVSKKQIKNYNITSNTVGLQAYWPNFKSMFEVEFAA